VGGGGGGGDAEAAISAIKATQGHTDPFPPDTGVEDASVEELAFHREWLLLTAAADSKAAEDYRGGRPRWAANGLVAPGKGQCAQAPGPHPAQALAAAGAGAPPRRAAGPPQGPTSPQQGAETPSGLKGGKGHSRVYPAGWHDQCHDRLSDCQKEYPVSSSQSHNHKLLPPYTS
jgi:hypothetical protein